MRVLFVTALPQERSSFLGRTFPLAQALHRAGHNVDLLTLSGSATPPFENEETREGIVIRTCGPNLRATHIQALTISEVLRRLRLGRAALTAELTRRTADVVVLAKPQLQNTQPTLSFARERRIPLVLDADDFEPAASRFPLPVRWIMAAVDRRAARSATAISACSPFLVEHYRRLNPRAHVEFLPTSIAVPPFVAAARLRERLGIPADAKILLYAGSLSLSSAHRVDQLLVAFAQLHSAAPRINAHMVIAGDGLDEQRLKTTADSLVHSPSSIHFLGRFTPPEDIALAREADLLVDPVDNSVTAEAKSSHRMMLALATGTPIVAGNVGIRTFLLPEALHADALYDPDDPGALASSLARGLDQNYRTRFREQTAGLIDQWTWETLGKKFVSLLESLSPRVQ